MSFEFQIHPEASEEAEEAGRWYEFCGGGELREDFDNAIEVAVNKICTSPFQFHVRRKEFRALVVTRFPFVIHFRLRKDFVYVVAIAHGSRRPDYWWDRDKGD